MTQCCLVSVAVARKRTGKTLKSDLGRSRGVFGALVAVCSDLPPESLIKSMKLKLIQTTTAAQNDRRARFTNVNARSRGCLPKLQSSRRDLIYCALISLAPQPGPSQSTNESISKYLSIYKSTAGLNRQQPHMCVAPNWLFSEQPKSTHLNLCICRALFEAVHLKFHTLREPLTSCPFNRRPSGD